jgi:hypothetical protein
MMTGKGILKRDESILNHVLGSKLSLLKRVQRIINSN